MSHSEYDTFQLRSENFNPFKVTRRNSLAVQWLGLGAFTAEGLGSIPGRGTKILQGSRCGQKKIFFIN